jgi:hypothetical protein
MKNVRKVVLLSVLTIAVAVFSLVSFLPFAKEISFNSQEKQLVSASTRFSPDFERRFGFIEPVWDAGQWYAQREKGSMKLSGSREQYFNLQSRFYNKTGADVSGIAAPGVLPVFSSSDMNDIAAGNSRTAGGVGASYNPRNDRAGFVMLDNDSNVFDNRVTLELMNLTSITSFEASFNGIPFGSGSRNAAGTVVGPGVSTDIGGNFASVDGNADLHNSALFQKDLSNPNASDQILWGRAANGEFQIRGMFNREGYYQFRFDVAVWGTSADRRISLEFGFYIGHASRYMNVDAAPQKNMPVFDLDLTTVGQGRPVMPGLMRPSASTARDAQGNYFPINNDRFFYNYQASFPSIQFRADRYSVSVSMTDHNKVPQTVPRGGTNTHPVFTFNQLGNYQVDATMRFPVTIRGAHIGGGVFAEENRVIQIPNFAAHRYFLDIFGFQAQYWDYGCELPNCCNGRGCYKWFAGNDARGGSNNFVSSDITNFEDATRDFKNDPDFIINKSSAQTRRESADNAIESLVGKLDGIAPVVTNSPPVSLRYNVSHAYADMQNKQPLTRVAYRRNTTSPWVFDTPYGNRLFPEYVVGRPFEQAGEYAIIAYYEYNAAEEVGKIYSQIFYFRINDFASEIMIQARDRDNVIRNFSFADLMGQRLHTRALGIVYKSGGGFFNTVGPFEVAPRLELIYSNFAGTQVEAIPDYDPARVPTSAVPWYGKDGIYTFRVYYGNNRFQSPTTMPHMNFTVIVDTTPIQRFQCYIGDDPKNTGLEVRNGSGGAEIPNISVFGGGDVTLAWDRKESGVDMLVAKLDFYEFRVGGALYPTTVQAEVLSSQFEIRPALSRSLRILPTESGYRLADKLTASGLYVINIMDAAGVETQYIIIIDRTTATIAQDKAVDPTQVNIKREDTSVGFGREKFIPDKGTAAQGGGTVANLAGFFADLQENHGTLYTQLLNSGIFVAGANPGIKIPIMSAEMSTDGRNYIPVFARPTPQRPLGSLLVPGNQETRNHHFRELVLHPTNSVTYFFRVVDATGNVALHYVELNPDRTMGVIFEDDVSQIVQNGVISPSATILQSGMISNRDFLTFSFMQADTNDPWRVDQVNIAFYPLTFQRESIVRKLDEHGNPVIENDEPVFEAVPNINYPFSITPEIFHAYTAVGETVAGERIPVNINRHPHTRQGLYVIARICNNAHGFGQPDIRNYHFIVDNNPIIANRNFETGVRVQFGTGTSSRTAGHNDFERMRNSRVSPDVPALDPDRDRVLRANASARVLLPGSGGASAGATGTKYGRTFVDSLGITRGELNNSFSILKGDLMQVGDDHTHTFTFNSLNITKSLEYRAPGATEFVSQPVDQNSVMELAHGGMYRVALTDGSGGYSWILGAGAPRPPMPNNSEILMEIITDGPRGTFAINGRQIASSSFNVNGNLHSVRVNDKANDRLTFTYVVSDSSNFLQSVGSPPSSISLRRANGTTAGVGVVARVNDENVNRTNLVNGRALMTEYVVGTVRFCEITLPLASGSVSMTDTFLVTLSNGTQTRTLELTLDNTPPKFNLNRVANQDAFFGSNVTRIINHAGEETPTNRIHRGTSSDNRLDIEIGNGTTLRYPFRLSNNFCFDRAGGTHTFDTFSISYFEVDSRLSNISGERPFSYNQDTFYNIVGMQANENRFFRIVERDEAGNRADYFVQLRGVDFVDRIDASGVVEYTRAGDRSRPTGRHVTDNFISEGGIVRGHEMSVENVRQFFATNLFFEFTGGGTTVRRFGHNFMAVNDQPVAATAEVFATEVQKMLNAGQGGGYGGSISFNLNNRFKSFGWTVRQTTRDTGMASIVAEGVPFLNDIDFVVDDSRYPVGLRNSSGFIFEVYNLSDLSSGPITARTTFWSRGVYVEDKNHEYLIVVTDEFGRIARYAHNGLFGSRIELRFDDAMSDYIGGDLYVGSGVEVVYSPNAYDIEIFKDGVLVFRNGVLFDSDLAEFLVFSPATPANFNARVQLLTEEGEITHWSVVAHRRGTGARWSEEFFLYGELPVLRFTNQSGETLVNLEQGLVTSGIVTVSYSLEGLLFGASLEYTRAWTDANGNPRLDFFPISEFMTRFNLVHAGEYTFTVTNALGFSSDPRRYVFTIDDVSNRHFKVYFDYGNVDVDGNAQYDELVASPKPYHYNSNYNSDLRDLYIPHYFVRGFTGDTSIIESSVHERSNITRPLQIVPTTNSRREVRGWGSDAVNLNRYYEDVGSNTRIYRLVSPITKAEIFLAITLVEETNSFGLGFNWGTGGSCSIDGSFQHERSPTTIMSSVYQPLYRANDAITIGFNSDGYFANTGNVIYVDYFRDGSEQALGRLEGTQKLTILARDYGVYTFRVTDHAGNVRRFTHTDAGGSTSIDHYTFMNLSRAPLYIIESGAQGVAAPIIDGMVYSDSVALFVANLPFGISNSADVLATKVEVYQNNILRESLGGEASTKDQERRAFPLSEPGHYRIVMTYRIVGFWTNVITSRYEFTIVSSTTPRQSFSFVAPQNTEVTSIRYNGNEIRPRFADTSLRQISFNTGTGSGVYVVTVRMGADHLHQNVRTRTFSFIIRSVPRIDVFASVDFGKSTTSQVAISVVPRTLVTTYGDCRVLVLRDGELVEDILIGTMGEIELGTEPVTIAEVKDAGRYTVYVTSLDASVADGVVTAMSIHSTQGFRIVKAQSPLGTIILVIVIVVLVVGVLLFIRLRTRMRVR